MAAGLGFKDFVTGEVLTAADVDGYLMQGIWVFADATARDAAVTSPQEGNACYLKDTNEVLTYSGSVWVAVGGGSPLTTKGDLYTFSTVDARLAVGANDTVLTADSSEATGLKWAAGGSATDFTLLNAGGTALTGAATITVSITAYTNIYVFVKGASSAAAASEYSFRFNGDSGNNYRDNAIILENALSAYSTNTGDTSVFKFAKSGNDAGHFVEGSLQIFGAKSATGLKPVQFVGAGYGSSLGSPKAFIGQALYLGTSAITSISIISGTGNFDAGTIFVYGAN